MEHAAFNYDTATDEQRMDLGELLIEAALGDRILVLGEKLTWVELMDRVAPNRQPDGVLNDAKIERCVITDIEPHLYWHLVQQDGAARFGLVAGRNCTIELNLICIKQETSTPSALELNDTIENNPQLTKYLCQKHPNSGD